MPTGAPDNGNGIPFHSSREKECPASRHASAQQNPHGLDELVEVPSPSENGIRPGQRGAGINGQNCPLQGGKPGRNKHARRGHIAGRSGRIMIPVPGIFMYGGGGMGGHTRE